MTEEEIKEYWRTAYCNEKHKKEQLEQENAELKKKIGFYQKGMFDEIEKRDKKLTKAIKIIKGLLSCCRNYPQENAEKIKQAEQFLKEIEK